MLLRLLPKPNVFVAFVRRAVHNVRSDSGLFDSGFLRPNEKFRFCFNEEGTSRRFMYVRGNILFVGE